VSPAAAGIGLVAYLMGSQKLLIKTQKSNPHEQQNRSLGKMHRVSFDFRFDSLAVYRAGFRLMEMEKSGAYVEVYTAFNLSFFALFKSATVQADFGVMTGSSFSPLNIPGIQSSPFRL
jgi:hypothetical protein